MSQPDYQGRFIWHELLCSDTTAATFFYSQILSWKGAPFSPGSPYMIFTGPDGRPLAGAMRLSEEARAQGTPAHWRGYIGAADVDAILAQAVRLGARVLQPAQDVPAVGRVALLTDPEGALFGLYRPLPAAVAAEPAGRGFAWNELAARNRESALAFYQRLFGWELRAPIDMGGGFHYQTFGFGSQDLGGAYSIPPDRAMPPAWCPYATSASADDTAARVVAAGGQVCHGPIGVPGGGRIVQFFDSQHAMFAVHSMGAVTASPTQAPAPAPQEAVTVGTLRKAARQKPARKVTRKVARKAKPKPKPKTKAKRKAAGKPAKSKAKKKATRRPTKRKSVKRGVKRPVRARRLARKK
jgi:predicted enzyme related to lactoylglutathione lyase